MKRIVLVPCLIACVFLFAACAANTKGSPDDISENKEPLKAVRLAAEKPQEPSESQEDNAAVKAPTGYASGEVQRPCLFYDGKLYVAADGGRRELSALSGTLTDAAKVIRNDNNTVPSEEGAAAQIKEGTKILRLQSEEGDRLFYQLDEGTVWPLEVYEYPPETLGNVAK